MALESAKYMGAVGSLLLVISGIGTFGSSFVGLLGLVGMILVLISLKGMADFYGERTIFSNALYALIAGIVGVAAFIGTLVAAFVTFMTNLPSWAQTYVNSGDWQGFADAMREHMTDFSSVWALFGSVIVMMVLALIVLFVFLVLAVFFFRRSLGLLSKKTHVGLFGTAGLLMLIGAVLTIILVGVVLIWIGWILLTVAFFSVKETAPPPQPPSMISSVPTQ